MQIKVISKLNNKAWDKFVDNSNNGTIFHKLRFLQYHDSGKFNFHNLIFTDQETIKAILPGELKNGVFKSPVGASYGSLVTKNDRFADYEKILDELIVYAKKNRIKEIYLTPPPIIYKNRINQLDNFLLEYKGFVIKSNLISHAVNLEDLAKDILPSLDKRFRLDVKNSYKNNLNIKLNSDDFKSFYSILLENKLKFHTVPTHTYSELIKLKKLFPNNIYLLMAYNDKTPISGVLLFICNKTTVLVFYICHIYKYRRLNAVSRLLYESLVWAKQNGYKWMDIGVSMDTLSENPMEPSRSLIFFKEATSARGFLRTSFYKRL